MEPVEWILIVALLFGGGEHIRAEHHKDKAEEAEAKALELIEVSKKNENTIIHLEAVANECSRNYQASIDKINQFKEVKSIQDSAIQNLKTELSNTDFAECRVPDWVSLEIKTPTRD